MTVMFGLMGGWRMTGSAYQAMDVFATRDSLYRVGVWGRDGRAVLVDPRLADCSKMLYIHAKLTFWGVQKREVFG